jgi:tetratricopeptide (TPR) repeat protein
MEVVVVVQLKEIDEQFVELRYRVVGSVEYKSRNLPSAEIAELHDLIDSPLETLRERDFDSDRYNLPKLGRQLFDWLDGSQRWLSESIDRHSQGLIIAIDAQARLGGLPWEILSDDKGFLVTRSIVPIRVVGGFAGGEIVNRIADRELRALFMATDPIDVYPKLNFEREERAILQATRELPMELRVEESGCLEELKGFWGRFRGKFDVFHLNGHADIKNGVPYFITEDLEGRRVESRLEDLVEVFKLHYPPLTFLSGCRTGESTDRGATSSLAANLVAMGAPAVLGWGRPVGDDNAIDAAMLLYKALAQGKTLAEALALTYGGLIRQNVPDWCLLRLYARFGAWDALVFSPGDGMWAPFEEASTDFLDAQGLVKVAGRDGFVGRRRYLQRGLRALKPSSSNLGIWLHGIGGVGKSTIAARLLDRLQASYERLVIVGVFDEDRLKNLLSRQCMNPTGHQILQGDLPLAQKLARFLKHGLNEPSQRFIFVLDDFEQNLEPNGAGEQVLKAAVVHPLMALLEGMSLSKLPHRVMITCRYTVRLEPKYQRRIQQFPVQRMDKADEEKLFDRLESFAPRSGVDADVRSQARAIADGYPRLLEWLDRVLADPSIDPGAILTAMKDKQAEFLENILAAKLLEQQQRGLQKMLERGTLFDLPVPLGVLKSICGEFEAELERHVARSLALGLLETGLTDGLVRVPKVLNLTLKQKDKQKLAALAVGALYDVWIETAPTPTEEQQVEIHRLAMLGGDGKIAVEMAQILSNSWINVGRYYAALTLCADTLALQKDGTVIDNLAQIYESQGQFRQALERFQESIDIYNEINNPHGVAASLHQKSRIHRSLGEFTQALKCSEESLDIYREISLRERTIGNRKGEADSLHQQSRIHRSLGEFIQSLSLSQQSSNIYLEIGDRQGEADSLHQQSRIRRNLGEFEIALQRSQESLSIYRDIGNRKGEANSLHQQSRIHQDLGNLQQALSLSQQSIEIQRSIGYRQGEAASLQVLSIVKYSLGNLQQALHDCTRSIEIYEQIDNPHGVAASKLQKSRICRNFGDLKAALKLAKESISIDKEIGHRQGEADSIHQLSRIYHNLGKLKESLECAKQSNFISIEITYRQGIAHSLHQLSRIYQDLGNLQAALKFAQQSVEINKEISNRQGEATSLHQLSRIYQDLGNLKQALSYSNESKDIYTKIGNRQGEAASLHVMSKIHQKLGDLDQALAFSEQSIDIKIKIGNRQEIASSLDRLSKIHQNLGDLDKALKFSQDSKDIFTEIGNPKGEADSWEQMASIASQQEEPDRAREHYLKASAIRGKFGYYGGLIKTLCNLGFNDKYNPLKYFAQALWLTLRLSTNQKEAINLIQNICAIIPSGDPLKALLGATARLLCDTPSHPEFPQLTERSRKMLEDAASQQGIDTSEERETWFVANRLGDADDVLAATSELLESMVGDGWLFDRSGL